MNAKGKLRPASILAIIGGIGVGSSVIFPYFSVTFLITISLSPIDLGVLVWGPLALSAILSLIAGINLNSSLAGNPKGCLVISNLSVLFSWFIVYLQYQDYYEHFIQEMGFAIPLNFEIGLIIGAISSLMIIVSTIIVFSNQNSYIFLVNTYQRQKLRLYQQKMDYYQQTQQQAPLDRYDPQTKDTKERIRMSQLICPNCGAMITFGTFCGKCGTKGEIQTPIAPIEERKEDKAQPIPKFCTNCGTPISGVNFCTNCGMKV